VTRNWKKTIKNKFFSASGKKIIFKFAFDKGGSHKHAVGRLLPTVVGPTASVDHRRSQIVKSFTQKDADFKSQKLNRAKQL
jgi:hypothetical protein